MEGLLLEYLNDCLINKMDSFRNSYFESQEHSS